VRASRRHQQHISHDTANVQAEMALAAPREPHRTASIQGQLRSLRKRSVCVNLALDQKPFVDGVAITISSPDRRLIDDVAVRVGMVVASTVCSTTRTSLAPQQATLCVLATRVIKHSAVTRFKGRARDPIVEPPDHANATIARCDHKLFGRYVLGIAAQES
jgi:hypothetical protein